MGWKYIYIYILVGLVVFRKKNGSGNGDLIKSMQALVWVFVLVSIVYCPLPYVPLVWCCCNLMSLLGYDFVAVPGITLKVLDAIAFRWLYCFMSLSQ